MGFRVIGYRVIGYIGFRLFMTLKKEPDEETLAVQSHMLAFI